MTSQSLRQLELGHLNMVGTSYNLNPKQELHSKCYHLARQLATQHYRILSQLNSFLTTRLALNSKLVLRVDLKGLFSTQGN